MVKFLNNLAILGKLHIEYYQYLNQNDYVGHNVYQKMRSVPNFERISIKSSKNESDYSKESRISQENINKKTKLGDIANSFLASPLMRQLSSENDDYKGGQGFRKSHCESNYSEGIKNKVKLNPGEMSKNFFILF